MEHVPNRNLVGGVRKPPYEASNNTLLRENGKQIAQNKK